MWLLSKMLRGLRRSPVIETFTPEEMSTASLLYGIAMLL